MRILTFQDKYVLETLILNKTKKIYEYNDTPQYDEKHIDLFKRIKDKMVDTLGLDTNRYFNPIWGWVISKNTELTDEYLEEIFNRHIVSCDRLVALELDVPKEFLLISNYSVWDDLLFKAKFNQQISDDDFNRLFKKEHGAILQVSMPFISVDFVKSYKDYNDFMSKDYSDTDRLVKEELSKGKLKLDNTGNYIESYK